MNYLCVNFTCLGRRDVKTSSFGPLLDFAFSREVSFVSKAILPQAFSTLYLFFILLRLMEKYQVFIKQTLHIIHFNNLENEDLH